MRLDETDKNFVNSALKIVILSWLFLFFNFSFPFLVYAQSTAGTLEQPGQNTTYGNTSPQNSSGNSGANNSNGKPSNPIVEGKDNVQMAQSYRDAAAAYEQAAEKETCPQNKVYYTAWANYENCLAEQYQTGSVVNCSAPTVQLGNCESTVNTSTQNNAASNNSYNSSTQNALNNFNSMNQQNQQSINNLENGIISTINSKQPTNQEGEAQDTAVNQQPQEQEQQEDQSQEQQQDEQRIEQEKQLRTIQAKNREFKELIGDDDSNTGSTVKAHTTQSSGDEKDQKFNDLVGK